jgi:hypothetical protein
MPYMVTFTINIPQMLANIPYMDPMGMLEMWIPVARAPQSRTSSEPSWSVTKMLAASPRDVYRAGCRAGWSNTRHVMFPKSIIALRSEISIHCKATFFLDIYNVWTFNCLWYWNPCAKRIQTTNLLVGICMTRAVWKLVFVTTSASFLSFLVYYTVCTIHRFVCQEHAQ